MNNVCRTEISHENKRRCRAIGQILNMAFSCTKPVGTVLADATLAAMASARDLEILGSPPSPLRATVCDLSLMR